MYVSVFNYILSISSIFLIIFVQQIFVRIYDLSFITLHIYGSAYNFSDKVS